MIRAFLTVGILALAGNAFAAAGHRPPSAPPIVGVANLNTATEKQLELLPGVGPSRAKAIVAYRDKNHLTKPEQIRQVKGVGRGVYKRIEAHVAVSGPTTIAKAH